MKTIKLNAPCGFTFGEFNKQTGEVSLVPVNVKKEVGKWYIIKCPIAEDALLCFQEKNSYGFGFAKVWVDSMANYYFDGRYEFMDASPEYVKERLILEAKNRGFDKGTKFMDVTNKCELTAEFGLEWDELFWVKSNFNMSICRNKGVIFYDGVWAEILPPEKKYPTSVDEVEGRKWYVAEEGYISFVHENFGGKRNGCLSSQSRSKAFLALMQLVELRDAWNKVDGFVANWENGHQDKFTLRNWKQGVDISKNGYCHNILHFGSAETRDKFLYEFRSLIEEAKELL